MALNKNILKKEIKNAIKEYFPIAFKEAQKAMFPFESDEANAQAKRYGEVFTDVLADPLATSLASAIDAYIKNASITGIIITSGGPTTQIAKLSSSFPLINGKVPNTLGIE